MRVLVDGLDTVIEGEVIGGELLDGVSGQYDLESAFTVKCDDGVLSRPRLAGGCGDSESACAAGDVADGTAGTAVDLLSLRERQSSRVGPLCDVLHAETTE